MLVLRTLIYLIFPLLLFTKNPKMPVTLLTGFYVLIMFCKLVTYRIHYTGYIQLAAIISLFILSIWAYNEKLIITKIWFVPGLLMLIYILFTSVIIYRIFGFRFFDFFYNITEAFCFLFIGLWFKKDSEKYTKVNNVNNQIIGSADKISLYKELLDLGVLTEEEFEFKKKEALNL